MLIEAVSRTDVLMSDNALLQRQMYKYESGAAEVGDPLKCGKAELELKRLCEQQSKQIVHLQRECEA